MIINKIENLNDMINSVFVFLGVLVTSFVTFKVAQWKYKTEIIKAQRELIDSENQRRLLEVKNEKLHCENVETNLKIGYFNQIMDVTSINVLSNAVDRMFNKTKADRFLILFAINGKTDFNVISVIFEQHKNKSYRINAIARYHNIHIDQQYKKLLKQTEIDEIVIFNTDEMTESMLKDFYIEEKVKHSILRKLIRKPVDNDNDILIYSSISTHETDAFTRTELSLIKTQYEGTIIPNITQVLDNR